MNDAHDIARLEAEAFRQGWNAGVTAFAWWKDGVQYVGTCGMTLEGALAQGPHEELRRPMTPRVPPEAARPLRRWDDDR